MNHELNIHTEVRDHKMQPVFCIIDLMLLVKGVRNFKYWYKIKDPNGSGPVTGK